MGIYKVTYFSKEKVTVGIQESSFDSVVEKPVYMRLNSSEV